MKTDKILLYAAVAVAAWFLYKTYAGVTAPVPG